jgi:hypothetical protein
MVVMNAHDNRTLRPAPFNGGVAMQQHLFKLCADSLRTFANNEYHIKLKATHAHELVAAFFGYASKNSMLADSNYPVSNLDQAEIIVMTPDEFLDKRRKKLQELSSELPDNYTLGEAVYASLFSDECWASPYPPFRSFENLAKFLVENNEAYKNTFKFYRDIPMHHIVYVDNAENGVLLTVIHSHRTSTGEMLGVGKTTIDLTRVAGHIGYSKPHVSVEIWTGNAKRTLGPLEVES